MKKPESWDARDFIFGGKYYCPICATPEDGTCQVQSIGKLKNGVRVKCLKKRVYKGIVARPTNWWGGR